MQVNPALEDAEYRDLNNKNAHPVNPSKADMTDNTPATTGAGKA